MPPSSVRTGIGMAGSRRHVPTRDEVTGHARRANRHLAPCGPVRRSFRLRARGGRQRPRRSADSTPATPWSARARAASGSSSSPTGPPASRCPATGVDDRPGGVVRRGRRSSTRAGRRTASVVAESPLRVFGITAWQFTPLLEQHPSIAVKIAEILARRLREAEERSAATGPTCITPHRAQAGGASGTLLRQSALAGPIPVLRGAGFGIRAGVSVSIARSHATEHLRTASGPEGRQR